MRRSTIAPLLAVALLGCQPRATAQTISVVVEPSLGPLQLAFKGTENPRLLRGDWEAPATLLITYREDWKNVLGELAASARVDTDVVVAVNTEDTGTPALQRWLESHELRSITLDHDTPWIRDYGPFEVVDNNGKRHWVDMVYDDERPLDDGVPLQLANFADIPIERHGLSLDGGGLISNGAGHCAMTTASFDAFVGAAPFDTATSTVEQLGCQVLTVVPSLSEEETGHIDLVAQFLTPNVVAVADVYPATRRADADALAEAVELLRAGAKQLGQPLRVVRVPLVVSGAIHYSYINGTRLRESFLVPAYLGVPEPLERLAYDRLRSGLPKDVELVPVFSDEFAELGGAVHCVTLGVGTYVRSD